MRLSSSKVSSCQKYIYIKVYDCFLAIDRVHRIGQERTVFVTHFIVCTLTLSHSLHSV